jgi:predicted Zn finger-like uncharacterized protein
VSDCSSKYFLPEEKVPVSPLKVRCPKCRAVFMLAGRAERAQVAAMPAGVAEAATPVVEPTRTMRKFAGREHSLPATAVAIESAPVEAPPAAEAAPVAAVEEAPAPVAVEPVSMATPEPVVQEKGTHRS